MLMVCESDSEHTFKTACLENTEELKGHSGFDA